MAKKERKDEIVFSPAADVPVVEEEKSMFETEAYGSPKPDAGSDVTVMKQVGIGGPVPIVAPKHNTIQLQPIVVPLAVVPYMTQDSNILRTDGKQQQAYNEEEYGEETKFENVASAKKKIKNKQAKCSRIFSFITLLISLLIEVPFIISYFGIKIGGEDLSYLSVIGFIDTWVHGGSVENIIVAALFIATFIFTGIIVLFSFLTLIFGKYPRGLFGVFSFVSFGTMIALMIMQIINKTFDPSSTKIFIALIAVTAFNFLTSIIFSIVLNRIEDIKEQTKVSEI